MSNTDKLVYEYHSEPFEPVNSDWKRKHKVISWKKAMKIIKQWSEEEYETLKN